MDFLSIISLIVGLVSIGLAIFSIVYTKKTEDRIISICKTIRKLIDGRQDEE